MTKESFRDIKAKFIRMFEPYEGDSTFSHLFHSARSAIKFWAYCRLHFPYTLIGAPSDTAFIIQFDPSQALFIHEALKSEKKSRRHKTRGHRNAPEADNGELATTLNAIKSSTDQVMKKLNSMERGLERGQEHIIKYCARF